MSEGESSPEVIQSFIDTNNTSDSNQIEDQIKEILGLTIAMMYVLDESSPETNRKQFVISGVIMCSDVVADELTQYKVQMYLALIERIQEVLDIKDNQQLAEYMSALDGLWTDCLAAKDRAESGDENTDCADTDRQLVLELSEEMRYHSQCLRRFITRLSFMVKGLELICGDNSREQSTVFTEIFCADITLRRLKSMHEWVNECADRLDDRLNQLVGD